MVCWYGENLFSILFNKLFYHLFLICSLSSFPSWKTLTLIPTKTEQVPLLFKVHAPALSGSLIIPDTNPGVFTNHQNTRYHTKEFEGIRFKIYQIYCIKIFNSYIFGHTGKKRRRESRALAYEIILTHTHNLSLDTKC